MTTFESELLADLRERVAQRDARTHRTRSRVLGGSIAAAVTGVVAALAWQPAAAYAVDTESDGDVVVTIRELKDAEGLERALAEKGIESDVSYQPMDPDLPLEEWPQGHVGSGGSRADDIPDQSGSSHGEVGTPLDPTCLSQIQMEHSDDQWTFTLPHAMVDAGGRLHVITSGGDRGATLAVSWEGDSC